MIELWQFATMDGMSIVVQMTRTMSTRAVVPAVEGIRLRNYRGPEDIVDWLDLRRRAFARQRVGVGDWDECDFRREFLEKPWWKSERMWFAELADSASAASAIVGTVTLAQRGTGASAKPVVHWLAVLGGYRRRGIGRLLMATLEAAVWDSGGRQVWLETHNAWREAARLYESLGYKAVE
jgi:GNAT superfamily N-acetyltransferase